MSRARRHRLEEVEVDKCRLLERNPQYLTPSQLDALQRSIERDGFTVPILVRPKRDGVYEIVSGNHRYMAAKSLGYTKVPAVVAKLSDAEAKRLAINLNLIHGNPLAEQLAPFLADCPDDVLRDLHLEGDLLADVKRFDAELGRTLAKLEIPSEVNDASRTNDIHVCECPSCGRKHHRASTSS